jgi:hypothetical protein
MLHVEIQKCITLPYNFWIRKTRDKAYIPDGYSRNESCTLNDIHIFITISVSESDWTSCDISEMHFETLKTESFLIIGNTCIIMCCMSV